MENTKTVNVISTPNIQGNVGSCTTRNEQVVEHSGFWKDRGTNVITNSCTGVVEKIPYQSLNGGAYFIGFAVFVLLILTIIALGGGMKDTGDSSNYSY